MRRPAHPPPAAAWLAAAGGVWLASCSVPAERPEPPPTIVPPIADADLCREGPKYIRDGWVRDWERIALADRMRALGCPPA